MKIITLGLGGNNLILQGFGEPLVIHDTFHFTEDLELVFTGDTLQIVKPKPRVITPVLAGSTKLFPIEKRIQVLKDSFSLFSIGSFNFNPRLLINTVYSLLFGSDLLFNSKIAIFTSVDILSKSKLSLNGKLLVTDNVLLELSKTGLGLVLNGNMMIMGDTSLVNEYSLQLNPHLVVLGDNTLSVLNKIRIRNIIYNEIEDIAIIDLLNLEEDSLLMAIK